MTTKKSPAIVSVIGAPGGAFMIQGYNLGSVTDVQKEHDGSVTIAGRSIRVTAWYQQDEDHGGLSTIKGQLPADISKGEVVVRIPGSGVEVKGQLNSVPSNLNRQVQPEPSAKEAALATENEDLKRRLAELEKKPATSSSTEKK